MSTDTETAMPVVPALIVFGRDGAAKPHASSFAPSEAELAEKAASLMGMKVLRVESDEQRELAAQLPSGKVFASGRAFVPFVKAALYARLHALSGAARADQPPAATVTAADPETPPAAIPEPPKAEAAKPDATGAKSVKLGRSGELGRHHGRQLGAGHRGPDGRVGGVGRDRLQGRAVHPALARLPGPTCVRPAALAPRLAAPEHRHTRPRLTSLTTARAEQIGPTPAPRGTPGSLEEASNDHNR